MLFGISQRAARNILGTSVSAGADVATEARKLVEHVLLTETIPKLPICGADILKSLEIAPGVEVERLLQRARILYDQDPCTKNQLMERLRNEASSGAVRPDGLFPGSAVYS